MIIVIILIELFAEKRFLEKYFKYFPNEYHHVFRISIVKALSNKKISPYYLISKILRIAINNINLDMIESVLDRLQLKGNFSPSNKFYRVIFELNDKESNNLKILIDEARELLLMLNL